MRIIQDITKAELTKLLNDFYMYFEDGFAFENFLKYFLEAIGLSEVAVTQKTRDGGIDLIAVKDGLAEVNNLDSVKYKIQAKRILPSNLNSPEKINALRGKLKENEKGLFITTGRVSAAAKENAVIEDLSRPIFVIDGMDLIKLCIEKQIGFAYKPIFSKSALDEFTCKITNLTENTIGVENTITGASEDTVSKLITLNDVRCSLISVPRFIVDRIANSDKKQKMKVFINNSDSYELTYSPNRRYLYLPKSKEFFAKYGIIKADGTIQPKSADWRIDQNQNIFISITE
ncbi:MAG: restriction endonuclease [Clostridia bacterium]|nr:restriction endonuclease [Clostridia bacterium]